MTQNIGPIRTSGTADFAKLSLYHSTSDILISMNMQKIELEILCLTALTVCYSERTA